MSNDQESFNTVRTLSPECYRFRVVNVQGQDIHNRSGAEVSEGGAPSTFGFDDYTRVYVCRSNAGEPVPDYCHGRVTDRHAASFTLEAPAYYAATNAR